MSAAILNREQLDKLERRELQLTILSVVFVLILAGGLAAFMYPLVFVHHLPLVVPGKVVADHVFAGVDVGDIAIAVLDLTSGTFALNEFVMRWARRKLLR